MSVAVPDVGLGGENMTMGGAEEEEKVR